MKKSYLVPVAMLVLACSNLQPTATEPAATTPSEFKNLQVLPRDISRDQLIPMMRSFSRSLGVRCNHCHVVTATTPKEEFNFPSDAKEEKRVARVMIQMTQQINRDWLDRVEEAEGEHHAAESVAEAHDPTPRVSCWTCHRGHEEPEMPPPPPAPNQPAAPPPPGS